MKYIKKLPKENKEYSQKLLDSGWKKLKEPKLWVAMLIGLPIGILSALLNIKYFFMFFPNFKEIINYSDRGFAIEIRLDILKSVLYFVITIMFFILHEFIHILFMPDFIKSKKTFWGMKALYFFAYTEESFSKRRAIIIFAAPLVILSFVLPFILNMAGLMSGFIVFLCVFNAAGSYMDIFYIILILFKVPNGATITNKGTETFYKEDNFKK